MSNKENQFVYRPKIEKIEDLQSGDRFLVGEEKWDVFIQGPCHFANYFAIDKTGIGTVEDRKLARSLIRAKVPVERDIPCPEGYEIKKAVMIDTLLGNELRWCGTGQWVTLKARCTICTDIYAVPIAEPEPKVYTVDCQWHEGPRWINVKGDFQPGDKVTVQKVET